MDQQTLRTVVGAVVCFAVFGGVPIIMALLAHQQKMAELLRKSTVDSSDVMARLENIERKLSALEPRSQPPTLSGPTQPPEQRVG